ncbi:MAG: PadR family transcriptional regulator [Clostridia bacterium]
MDGLVYKRMFQGFVCLHILHHAAQAPVYGSWMMEELSMHGHRLGPGTLYPLLHSLEKEGLLSRFQENVEGKIRKYYRTTSKGNETLAQARIYLRELAGEMEGRAEHAF